MKLIDVNFNELKKINNDTVGWIKVEGTNINYPFVHTNNNDYYLNHSFDKSSNGPDGYSWIFEIILVIFQKILFFMLMEELMEECLVI